MPTTVAPTREQQQIVKVARRLLRRDYPLDRVRELMASADGSTPADWARVTELGWVGLATDEELGGAGYGNAERALLFEELGAALFPAPLLATGVLAVDVLGALSSTPPRDALLATLLDGSSRATLVAMGDLLSGSSPVGDRRAVVAADGFTLSGDGGLVLDGAGADTLIVVAEVTGQDGPGLFAVDGGGPGVTREAITLIDETRRVARVSFSAAPAERVDAGDEALDALRTTLDRARVALAAELVGAAQHCLDATVDYLQQRRQFGVPIGSFQALKHRCADMAMAVEEARQAVYLAADAIDEDDPAAATASAAGKLAAGEAFLHVAGETIQLHGGIGFTWDHEAHLYYKRAWVGSQLLGDGPALRDEIAEGLGL
jgi:alkylation response protein AidB-like acyl-CoA dehydrogenase